MEQLNEQQVIEDYYNLRSCRAVSEKYGCSAEHIRRTLKRNGIDLTGWKTTPEHSLPKKKYPDRHKYQSVSYQRICKYCGAEFTAHDKRKVFCSRMCKDRARHKLDIDPYKKICIVCGKEFETYREATVCCSPECSKGYHKRPGRDPRYKHTWEEYVAEAKAKAEARKAEKEKEKATANAIRIIWAIAEKRKDKYCAECGGVFHSEYPNKIYCSDRCQRKHRDRSRPKRRNNRSIRNRCRKYGVYYDPSVKPELVFKRDRMICQVCGEKCNPKDHTWGGIGPLYPSVDHIIPLAKGGAHIWDNVQTAHIICNSFKRDLLTEEASYG